jgi:hypothetical protein
MSNPEIVAGHTVGLKFTLPDDGRTRAVVVPLLWAIEALEQISPERPFHHEGSGVTFRMRDDGAIVASDEAGGVHVIPADERAASMRRLKLRLWGSWRNVDVWIRAIGESLSGFAQRVAEWQRMIPAELLETAAVETDYDPDEKASLLSVFYKRPPTPEEQAKQAEFDRHNATATEDYEPHRASTGSYATKRKAEWNVFDVCNWLVAARADYEGQIAAFEEKWQDLGLSDEDFSTICEAGQGGEETAEEMVAKYPGLDGGDVGQMAMICEDSAGCFWAIKTLEERLDTDQIRDLIEEVRPVLDRDYSFTLGGDDFTRGREPTSGEPVPSVRHPEDPT